jgi:hypothetical protein
MRGGGWGDGGGGREGGGGGVREGRGGGTGGGTACWGLPRSPGSPFLPDARAPARRARPAAARMWCVIPLRMLRNAHGPRGLLGGPQDPAPISKKSPFPPPLSLPRTKYAPAMAPTFAAAGTAILRVTQAGDLPSRWARRMFSDAMMPWILAAAAWTAPSSAPSMVITVVPVLSEGGMEMRQPVTAWRVRMDAPPRPRMAPRMRSGMGVVVLAWKSGFAKTRTWLMAASTAAWVAPLTVTTPSSEFTCTSTPKESSTARRTMPRVPMTAPRRSLGTEKVEVAMVNCFGEFVVDQN